MKIGNVENVQAWRAGGQPAPGTYTARIDACEEGKSTGGHPQLALSWTITGGDYDGAEVREWLVYTPAAVGKFKALIEATGIDVDLANAELTPEQLIGRHALIVVRSEQGRNDPTKSFAVVAGHKPGAAAPAAAVGSNGAATHDADKPPF